jgi:hypothetical protein
VRSVARAQTVTRALALLNRLPTESYSGSCTRFCWLAKRVDRDVAVPLPAPREHHAIKAKDRYIWKLGGQSTCPLDFLLPDDDGDVVVPRAKGRTQGAKVFAERVEPPRMPFLDPLHNALAVGSTRDFYYVTVWSP